MADNGVSWEEEADRRILPTTVSPANNNLAVNALFLAFASGVDAYIAHCPISETDVVTRGKSKAALAGSSGSFVQSVQWLRAGVVSGDSNATVLGVCCVGGLRLYDTVSSALLFDHALEADDVGEAAPAGLGRAGYAVTAVCSAAPVDGDGSPFVAVAATSRGEVLIFSVGNGGKAVELVATVDVGGSEESAVSVLASPADLPGPTAAATSPFVVSGSKSGTTALWQVGVGGASLDLVWTAFEPTGDLVGIPCTSVAMRNGVIYAAYGNGVVRLFDAEEQRLVAEIDAHGRAVTGLAVHPTQPWFATVGQDSVLAVFAVGEGTRVEALTTRVLEDSMPFGVAWSGRSILVSKYDSRKLDIFWIQS